MNSVPAIMVKHRNIAGGATTIFGSAARHLDNFTLTDTFDAAIVNDEAWLHGAIPVVLIDPTLPAYRDVLVVAIRSEVVCKRPPRGTACGRSRHASGARVFGVEIVT